MVNPRMVFIESPQQSSSRSRAQLKLIRCLPVLTPPFSRLLFCCLTVFFLLTCLTNTSNPKPSCESDANGTHDGAKEPSHPDHRQRPSEPAASTPPESDVKGAHHALMGPPHPNHQSRSLIDETSSRAKGKGKGRGKKRTNTNAITTPAATATAGQAPVATATAAAPAAAATAPPPGKWTYEAVALFLRVEGWNCADGHGFHTWFYVTRAADGKKSVDYLVSEKEVVDFVKRDRSVLARYEAYRHQGGGELSAPIGRSTQDDGGIVSESAGHVVVGAGSPCERGGAERRFGGARGAAYPEISVGARRRSKHTTVVRDGSGTSARVTRHVKEEAPSVGVGGASTKRRRSPRGGPVVGVAGTSPRGDDGRSVREVPVLRATRMSARVGRSTKHISLVKPALSTSTEGGRSAKTSLAPETAGGSAGGRQASKSAPVAQTVEPMTESARSAKDKPGKRAASLGGPVKHSAVIRAAVAAAENAVSLGSDPVKQRSQSSGLPQEPWSPQHTVDWAGRDAAKAPPTTPPSSPVTAISRAEIRTRPAAESKRRSSSAPAPLKALRGGWAGAARHHANGQQQQQQLEGTLGSSRKRSRETASWAQSWWETWPTLREEGWHWEYGKDVGATCVYLKPGVSRDGATLGVDMFDSKRAVVQHVLDSAEGSAAAWTAAAAGNAARPPVDESRSASTKKRVVGERARATYVKTRMGGKMHGVGEGARGRDDDLQKGGSNNHVPVRISRNAGVGEPARKSNDADEADPPAGVGDGGPSVNAPFRYPRGNDREGSHGCPGKGSLVEELAHSDDDQEKEEGRGNERSRNVRASAPASPLAERGTVGGAPGPPYQPRSAGVRNKQTRKTVGGEDYLVDNEGDMELAASVVMEMLRVEPSEAAGPAAKQRSTGSSFARKRLDNASDTAGAAPWGLDKMAAHCCEQLVALSELGGAGSLAGKPGGSGNDSNRAETGSGSGGDSDVDDGVGRTLKRKTPSPGSPHRESWSSERGGGRSKKKGDGVRATLAEASSPGSPPGSARSNETTKTRGGGGGGVPALQKNETGAVGPSTFGRPGPLSGVGVIIAGLCGGPRKEVEAEIIGLGGEVAEVFSTNGVADDEWGACLLGRAGRGAERGSAAASKSGDDDVDGPSPPPCRIILVASPGEGRVFVVDARKTCRLLGRVVADQCINKRISFENSWRL